jgi:hypothetical protein
MSLQSSSEAASPKEDEMCQESMINGRFLPLSRFKPIKAVFINAKGHFPIPGNLKGQRRDFKISSVSTPVE